MANELLEAQVDAFGRYTLQDLYDKYIAVYDRLSSREEELNTEMEAEEGRDALRSSYAEHAVAVRTFCDETTAAVGALSGSVQEQADELKALRETFSGSTVLADAAAVQAQVEEAGVVDNPYTRESQFSLQAGWDALDKVIEAADEELQAQILAERDEHMTPEQYKNIKEVFAVFDQDEDGALNPHEFHSCCTGIGLILTDEELETTMAEADQDGDGVIDFEEFTAFMMARLVEPGHSEEDVLGAFVDLSEKEEFVTHKTLQRTFQNEEHLGYLQTNMPSEAVETMDGPDTGYPYRGFVSDLFSR